MMPNYFTVQNQNSRWTLVDPNRQPFISIGLNHIEESNLLYPDNRHIWHQRYGQHDRWITQGVVQDLKQWGFNTIGWTQENIARIQMPQRGCRHSMGWSCEDYQTADMPYCVNLDIAEISGWNVHPHFPDVFSSEFDDWCAYLARAICTRHRNSRNLIGYFLTDVPAWTAHRSGCTFPQLMNVPQNAPERDQILQEIVHQYYRTITHYIREYDPYHLILGDRFNGNAQIIESIYSIAAEYVDVISIQYFTQGSVDKHREMVRCFDHIHLLTGKPLLLADIGNRCPTPFNPHHPYGNGPLADQRERANDYIASISPLIKKPYFVGWHWCSYIENPSRGWGLKDPFDTSYTQFTDPISSFNHHVQDHHQLVHTLNNEGDIHA